MYVEASKAAVKVEGHQKAVTTLLVANSYEQEDLAACRRQLDKCLPEDPDTMVNAGCILFKEGKFEAARQKFNDAVGALGYQPELLYNIALCFYKTKQFSPALKHLAEIIEKGVREHPELSIGRWAGGAYACTRDMHACMWVLLQSPHARAQKHKAHAWCTESARRGWGRAHT